MNLMQYLSVSGTLEGPREKFLSRRIGYSQEGSANEGGGNLAHPEPVALAESAVKESGQGEFGFVEPFEIDSSPSGSGNHLEIGEMETRPQERDQVEVYSRISPARVRVVRNDLTESDLAIRTGEEVEQYRPSLIAEEPSRRSWVERMRGRLGSLKQVSRWISRRSWRWSLAFKSFWPVGIMAGVSVGVLKVTPKKVAEKAMEKVNSTELQESIQMAKSYKTDVYVDGKVAWSYKEYVASAKDIVSNDNSHEL
ncbi:MAG TPA: hypothetical protein QGH16_04000 [Verrucomicrobiota bacterium]|jgi:hypothetical protein|nr:hypothetical protein [Verrucomicrobiota bacterium]